MVGRPVCDWPMPSCGQYNAAAPSVQDRFAGWRGRHYTARMTATLRPATETDLEEVLRLNNAAVPAVNRLAQTDIAWFLRNAPYFTIADDGGVAAFLVGLEPGLAYRSPNYRWFCERYDRFAYIDRIVVAPSARRLGLGRRLYDDFAARRGGAAGRLVCEVNIRPANDRSMRFHTMYGFSEIGRQETEGGAKEVALMMMEIEGDE